jgi:tetratricopeptide (TPR) repeat protein
LVAPPLLQNLLLFMIKSLLCVIMLITSFSYAQNSYNFKEAEMKCRQLVFTRPDSALVIIKKTLSQSSKLHDTIFGNTYNLYGMYYNMSGRPDSSIYYFKKSISFLSDFPRNRARSLLNMSMAYRAKGDYSASIKYANEALALNTKEKNNVGVAIAYGEIASNYNMMLDYSKSVNYLLKSIAILKAEKNTKQLVAVKQKLANTYLKMENFKFAIDLYKECLVDFKATGAEKNYYLTKVNMGEAYLHLDKPDLAQSYLSDAVTGLEKFGDLEMLAITLSKIGNLSNVQGQYDKAIASYKKAMDYLLQKKSPRLLGVAAEYINILNQKHNYAEATKIINITDPYKKFKGSNIEDRMIYQNAVANTYKGSNNDEKALEAYSNTIAIKDSIFKQDKEAAVHEIQAKFQTELQREKNLVLEANNRALKKIVSTEQKLMVLYIIISIAVLIIALTFLRGYRLKNKLQKITLHTFEAENNLIKQQHLYEQELNNSQKEVINEKQRELTSTALRMASYQDNLTEIINKCDANILTKVSDVKKELLQLIKQKDYWKQFETRFNNLHPNFNSNLSSRFAKLTKNDLEFCSLLKLNLSNKEIASLLQISHESAITKKYRIKKKMDINDDTEFEKLLTEI